MISQILPTGVVAVVADEDAAPAALLPDEYRVLGSVSNKRRLDFTKGRDCARRALLELGVPAVPILPGEQRQPLWPLGLVGSITHCQGYCAAAVGWQARFAAIGIDAEANEKLPRGILDMISLEHERRLLSALPRNGVSWDRLLFAAKESVYKAWFPLSGKWLGFKDCAVSFNSELESFQTELFVDGPLLNGLALTNFAGRYIVHGRHLLVAVVVGHPEADDVRYVP